MSSRRTYSSSAPNYDTRRPRRTYASPPPESYHGPHFERSDAQEEYWDSKGMRDVYHPFGELDDPIIARPDTYGLAHDFREPRLEHKYSDPYKKRPNPYTARTRADYDAYKGPSDSHGAIAKEVSAYKQIPLGNKAIPNNDHRRSLEKGKERSREGRVMSNL